MKLLLFIVLFTIVVLVIWFYDRIQQMKIFRSDEQKAAERAARKAAKDEEYFRRTSQKYYRKEEKPNFGEDYFKRAGEGKKKDKAGKETARRDTTSSDSVTIIDERQPTGNTASKEKKIFDDSEGEYVEFEEL